MGLAVCAGLVAAIAAPLRVHATPRHSPLDRRVVRRLHVVDLAPARTAHQAVKLDDAAAWVERAGGQEAVFGSPGVKATLAAVEFDENALLVRRDAGKVEAAVFFGPSDKIVSFEKIFGSCFDCADSKGQLTVLDFTDDGVDDLVWQARVRRDGTWTDELHVVAMGPQGPFPLFEATGKKAGKASIESSGVGAHEWHLVMPAEGREEICRFTNTPTDPQCTTAESAPTVARHRNARTRFATVGITVLGSSRDLFEVAKPEARLRQLGAWSELKVKPRDGRKVRLTAFEVPDYLLVWRSIEDPHQSEPNVDVFAVHAKTGKAVKIARNGYNVSHTMTLADFGADRHVEVVVRSYWHAGAGAGANGRRLTVTSLGPNKPKQLFELTDSYGLCEPKPCQKTAFPICEDLSVDSARLRFDPSSGAVSLVMDVEFGREEYSRTSRQRKVEQPAVFRRVCTFRDSTHAPRCSLTRIKDGTLDLGAAELRALKQGARGDRQCHKVVDAFDAAH